MRRLLLFLVAAGAIQAAIIRGTVVEHASGKPLARTLVVLTPVPGTPGGPQSLRTNTWGTFEFTGLPAGAFLVSASRRGFPPVHYGQKNWRAAGTPIVLAEDQATFLNVRMPRYGAITGLVVDENDVGMPEHEVVAYRYTRPPRLVGKAQVDDRGIFRIAGLDPGRYLVRTVGKQYEDGGYLPTFYHETQRVEEASFVDVDYDRDTIDAKVRPFPGRLFTIDGIAYATAGPMTLTLVSDIGRETQVLNADQPGQFPFQFPNKPPGPYEIWATAPGLTRGQEGAFVDFSLERDRPGMRINLLPQASIFFSFRGPQGQTIDAGTLKMQARRIDLAGEGTIENLRINNGRAAFVQGRWQIQLTPNPTYVATGFRGPRGERPEGGRADGWNEILINSPSGFAAYTLSSKPAGISGIVTNSHDPVSGAPVFLEPWDPVNNKRLIDLRVVRTDMHGQYQLTGLAPGTYRLFSTFEYLNPESYDIDPMRPRIVLVEEGRDQQQDLDLFVIQ
jgi:carboxypeptidase family protein